jgi:protein SCO1/2
MKLIFLLFSILVLLSCETKSEHRALPFIGNYELDYKMVNGNEIVDTIYPKMIDFTYLNQDSIQISGNSKKGKIWVADFFFTSCPSICPTMTTQLKRVVEATEDVKSQMQFLSFSINPKMDQPSVLKRYREKYGITAKNWEFLTGNEAQTHRLGIENFQIFAGEDAASAGGYAHAPAFTLVDKEGYIRGVYIGTDPKDVDRLITDIHHLIEIEYPNDKSK